MSDVPIIGTYTSENKNFKIKITSATPSNGKIEAIYETTYSPEGPFTVDGQIGHYSWVTNKEGKDGVAPFCIKFFTYIRPEKSPYCIYDTWTGAYQVDNTLLMEGARSYVNKEGAVKTMSLGTLTFFLQISIDFQVKLVKWT